MLLFIVIVSGLFTSLITAQHDPHFTRGRVGIVHLFEWKFKDIALECERFFTTNPYGGIQVSPVNENIIIPGRPWWERYQPLSYIIKTRSGDEAEFLDMTTRCNAVGVRIFVDVVFNHMAADNEKVVGTAGSTANPQTRDYPAVPYCVRDFHPACAIVDYHDPVQVRNCELVGLHDLNQTVPWVQNRIVGFLNKLIDLGVGGFRVDAAKHMWPADLKQIYSQMKSLNASFGFAEKSKPFIVQEVIDMGNEGVSKFEYNAMGRVTEFGFSDGVGRGFGGKLDLVYLKTIGLNWHLLPSKAALTFIDNHDNQRSGNPNILTYKTPREYRMAVAFMLAYPYGLPRIMSSFAFNSSDQGPPSTENGDLISPIINADGSCGGGYVCEHRWPQVRNMIGFRAAAAAAPMKFWWDNSANQIAFSRLGRGFIAFNRDESQQLNQTLKTGLGQGWYCNIISGYVPGKSCDGRKVYVNEYGFAQITINSDDDDGMIAFTFLSKLR